MTDITIERAKLEQVLEALEKHGVAPKDWACKECVPFSDILKDGFQCKYHKAITVAKQALEQPVQEPVAKVCHDLEGRIGWNPRLIELPEEGTELFTAAQPAPVTTREIDP